MLAVGRAGAGRLPLGFRQNADMAAQTAWPARETLERVEIARAPLYTPLKRGVNEIRSVFVNWSWRLIACLAALLLAGCTPPGPRALLEGRRLLKEGKHRAAVEELRTATVLLRTNALAWNDLGLACQRAGLAEEAERAYQRAVRLDGNLAEARYNLGCLWLAQNKPGPARLELTTCALLRPNWVESVLALGAAEWRLRDLPAAEKSFGDALRLSPDQPEALNGLGLIRAQRGHPADAAALFNRALKQRPGYAAALLNLAIVSHQTVRDRPLALQKYREYLQLKPAPANAGAVAAIARQLEQELNPPPRPPSPPSLAEAGTPAAPPRAVFTNPGPNVARGPGPSRPTVPANEASKTLAARSPTNVTRPALAANPEARNPALGAPHPTTDARPSPPGTPAPRPMTNEASRMPVPRPATNGSKPALTATPDTRHSTLEAPHPTLEARPSSSGAPAPRPVTTDMGRMPVTRPATNASRPALAANPEPPRPAHETPPPSAVVTSVARPVTNTARPAVAPGLETARAAPETRPAPPEARPSPLGAAAAPVSVAGGRYAYLSPARPELGNRLEAQRAFDEGLRAHDARQWSAAVQAYRQATQLDPAFFDAHYNLGLAATEAGNLPLGLAAYEQALAIRPNSADARYNFALALRKANHPQDAANELSKLLAIHPAEARAHLALANLYAEQLHQPAKARQHYFKVLELSPRAPQAGAIEQWLVTHPAD
jgi:tetratricopeptide (TPR) repeat protein